MATMEKINDLSARIQKVDLGGGEDRIKKQHDAGKKTARERIQMLIDPNSFVEIDAFVETRSIEFGMQQKKVPGDGVVTGYGTVNGRLVYVSSQDFTVIGGSLGEMHAKKITKVMDMAMKMGAPFISINDSGGARIEEGIDALAGFGEIFYRNTIASGVIPQISVIMGPCAGGAVYSPAITDFVFMVDKSSQMFITGPQVIKTVTGEEVSSEQLGGAMTHNSVSGVAHFIAQDEKECLDQIKKLLSFLPSNNMENPPEAITEDDLNRNVVELDQIIPENPNKPYDIKDNHTRLGFLITLVGAAIAIFFIGNPFKGLLISQMLLSIQLPWTIFIQVYLTSSPLVMGKYANTVRERIALWAIAFVVSGLNILLLVSALRG
jgi:acetyl-CoA carboxylase carboxyltransferase component